MDRDILDRIVLQLPRQQHPRRVGLDQRIVEVDRQVVLRIQIPRRRHVEDEGILLLRLHELLASRLGLLPVTLDLLPLALLLLGLDQPPRELQLHRIGLQAVQRIVLQVDELPLDRIRKLGRRNVEPQRDGILAHGLRIDDHPILRNAVESQRPDHRMRRRKVEHRLVLLRPLALRQHLTLEGLVGEHPEVELRLGRNVLPDRVVPHRKVGHLGRIPHPVDEAHLVAPRIVHLVVVLVLHGVDPVGDRLEVLRNEDTIVLRTADHRRLVVEERRVVLRHILHRIGRVEPDERLRNRIGPITVGRIARHDHRVDLRARRKDVAHRIERIALVVVADRTAEIQRIGRIRTQRVPHLDHNAAAPHRDRRLLLHLRRGEELLLLVLDLHELVELDVDLPVVLRRDVRREVVRKHRHDHRRQRVPRTPRRRHHARTAAQKGRGKEQKYDRSQKIHLPGAMGCLPSHHGCWFCVSASGS